MTFTASFSISLFRRLMRSYVGGVFANIVYSVSNSKLDKNVKLKIKQCIANK